MHFDVISIGKDLPRLRKAVLIAASVTLYAGLANKAEQWGVDAAWIVSITLFLGCLLAFALGYQYEIKSREAKILQIEREARLARIECERSKKEQRELKRELEALDDLAVSLVSYNYGIDEQHEHEWTTNVIVVGGETIKRYCDCGAVCINMTPGIFQ